MANFDVELNDEVENFNVEFGEIQRITVDDFDKLRNRPSYAGQTMTHETNIPEVPTAVSQLTNDADYQTGSEVESAISTAVGGEKDAREQADAGLSRDIGVVDGKVDAEADARERADIALQGAIDDEETARKNADNGLQGQIDAITSSSDVVDIVGTYAELLQYPTAGLGDKDVIKVLQDETHNDAMSYYRWNKSSSTWSYIGSEGPYYTKSETNTLLGDKQDTLTTGSNITISSNNTISATDTTYTAGNGLTLTGTEFSADTTVLQPKLTAGDGINISAQNVISADIDPADFFTASETVDGTGSEMTLNNTIQAKIKSVQMDGDTYQQTYSGKNLCGIPNQTFTHAGVSVTIQDGEITLNGTANASATYNIQPISTTTLNGTYTTSLVYVSGDISNTSQSNLNVRYSDTTSIVSGSQATIRNENSYRTWSVENANVIFGLYLSNGTVYNNVKFKYQITAGSSPDYSYEPYTGGIPAPNPDYPQPIQVVTGEQTVLVTGKNLLDSLHGYVDGYINSSGGVGAGGGTNALFDYITVIPGSNYTLSQQGANVANAGIAYFDANKTLISREQTYSFSSQTYSTPEGCSYVRIWVYRGGGINQAIIENAKLQFEQGSSASSYYPYQGQQSYPISLGATELCKIGTYQDYIYKSGGDWYVHKEIGKYVFDGDEGWRTTPYGTNSWILSDVIYFNFDSNKIQIMSNIATGIAHADRNTTTPNVMYSGSNNVFNFRNTSFTTLSALQTATKDSYVYYAIASPTDTKITDATLISELNALADALGYKDKTIITVSATGTNLPAILEVSAYRNSLAGVLGVIGRAEAA